MKALVDGVLVGIQPGSEPSLPADVDGVFETLRITEGAPVQWKEHWRRFSAGCNWFKLNIPVGPDALLALARSLVAENGIRDGVLRYAAWREDDRTASGERGRTASGERGRTASGEPGRTASGEHGRTAWRLEAFHPRASSKQDSVKLALGPVLPPAGPERAFKHLRRGVWLDALHEARAGGYDEAILRDANDRIVEGCVCNLFFEIGGVLRTPGVSSGPLPGIYRANVLEAARAAGIPTMENDCNIGELAEAREILLTNSLIGLRPVHEYNGKVLATGGQLLARLRRALADLSLP